MQRTYRQLIVGAITLSSIITFYTNREREKKNKIEQQQWNRLFDQQREQEEATSRAFGQWNDATEKQIYSMYYEQAARANVSDSVRAKYAACCVDKIKAMFPNGLSGVNDIIKIKAMKIDADCAESVGRDLKAWTPAVVKQLKLKFYTFTEVKLLPKGARAGFVDCLTDKVITKFPNGVIKGREKALTDLVTAARRECVITAVEKYTKPARKEKQKLPGVEDTTSVN